jgi:D-alanyl-D-alanine dipeptidase
MTHELSLKSTLPEGFVFLTDIDPTIIENSRYYTDQNFLARQVIGYKTPRIICTKEAALKLKTANDDLKTNGYKFVVYDGYRPQDAINEFQRWSKDVSDQAAKEYYYPKVNKKDVFKLGYIAEHSGHSRGSTFDLTLIETNKTLKPIAPTKRILKNKETIFPTFPNILIARNVVV